jgi:dipeptidyl aminopeptidase/acylaminoacyl peptidase
MKAALDKVGVEAELIVVRNGEHGFGGADPQEVGKAYARAVEWLTQHLKSQA